LALSVLDRILLNRLIQPFQQPERVVGFFNTYRQLYPVSRNLLRGSCRAVSTLAEGVDGEAEHPSHGSSERPPRRLKHYRGKLQTEIEDMNLPNPVIRKFKVLATRRRPRYNRLRFGDLLDSLNQVSREL
jgi:hypothetical protein